MNSVLRGFWRAALILLVNFDAANFGRIQTQAGTPRVLQFGIRYAF